MATLTIRNLPEEVRDQLRRAAAERGLSMEEEARQALAQRYRKQLTVEEIIGRLSRIELDKKRAKRTRMAASEVSIADRRLESLVESGLISRREKADWDRRIDDDKVSLAEVEQFVAKKRNWQSKKS
jgi:plasmid stability protein